MRAYSPGGALNALATARKGSIPPTPSAQRLRRGLPGYLIPFAPHAFEPQRQFRARRPLSPPVFLRISKHFTANPEFRLPLTNSRPAVSEARPRLSPGIPLQTDRSACAPFTPSNSEQRLEPPYYRGCWHGVSRSLFLRYRQTRGISSPNGSSLIKELYDPKAFITHAAWLDQAFAHCPIFPTAATRRCLGRISVPVWPINLSARLPITALVGHYPANKLMGGGLISRRGREAPFFNVTKVTQPHAVLAAVSSRYPPPEGRLSTCYSPVRRSIHPRRGFNRSTCMYEACRQRSF